MPHRRKRDRIKLEPDRSDRAALYARASTEHQRYSTANQVSAIRSFAEANKLQIVARFVDEGRSGLRVEGRPDLQRMLDVVVSGRADFSTILVYDVSRWGRFQDVDESAHHEFLCRKAGVRVRYCAEEFPDELSINGAVLKSIKRAMAAEFSRELSVKVSEGMKRLAAMGFYHGGVPPYGTRRLLVDERNVPRMTLRRGEAKHLQTDRVLLVHGPEEELNIVRKIFKCFVVDRVPRTHIANKLNSEGIPNSWGNEWTHNNILRILRNEVYIGNLVFNKSSLGLQLRKRDNAREQWIVSEGIFDPIVPRELFDHAQRILQNPWTYSDNDLLDFLSAALCSHGKLTTNLLRSIPGPTLTTYFNRFGRFSHTLKLIGYQGSKAKTYAGDPLYKALKPRVERHQQKSAWVHLSYRYRVPDVFD